jgi:hypothetical protein
MSELSLYRRSKELREKADAIWKAEQMLDRAAIIEERKRRNYDSFWMPVPATEPFRCVLAQVRTTGAIMITLVLYLRLYFIGRGILMLHRVVFVIHFVMAWSCSTQQPGQLLFLTLGSRVSFTLQCAYGSVQVQNHHLHRVLTRLRGTVQIRDKLYDTREILFHCSSHPSEDIFAALNRLGGLVDTRELMEVLQLFHRSLIETGDDGVANGAVLDAIRQVQTFGSSLVRLDIRQESTRHREVMSAITDFLDLGSFENWSEDERTAFLLKELQVLSFTCRGNSKPLVNSQIGRDNTR